MSTPSSSAWAGPPTVAKPHDSSVVDPLGAKRPRPDPAPAAPAAPAAQGSFHLGTLMAALGNIEQQKAQLAADEIEVRQAIAAMSGQARNILDIATADLGPSPPAK